jgi:ABC-type dipeptide/oligopeptide/nickel transport system permease subunit
MIQLQTSYDELTGKKSQLLGNAVAKLGTIFSITIIFCLIVMALSAPIMAPLNSPLAPWTVHLDQANLPPLSPGHFLGTDCLGKDLLSNCLWGARASLLVGITAACLAAGFGFLWGAISALSGEIIDSVMMRIVDGLLAVPQIVLLLVFQALISTQVISAQLSLPIRTALHITSYSQGLLPLFTVIFVISATSWLEAARIAQAQVRSITGQEYMEAAYAVGLNRTQLLVRHVLPNCAFLLILEACLLVSDAVLAESGLSFLGLGLGPSMPSWGTMLSHAEASLIQGNFWAALFPGLLISLLVLSVNLIGERYAKPNPTNYRRVTGRLAP